MEDIERYGKIEKSNYRLERNGDYVTEEIFCLLLRRVQKRDKKLEVWFFLAHLLVPLAGWPHFCLMLEASALGLTIDLAMSGAESIGGEVTIGFSEWS